MRPIEEIFETEFWAGAAGSFAVVAIVLVAALFASRPLPVGGLPFVLGGLAGLNGWGPIEGIALVPGSVMGGLVLLGAAGALVDLARLPSWALPPLLLPGAIIVAGNRPDTLPAWAGPAMAGAIALGGALVTDFDRHRRREGLGPLLLTVTVLGVYFCVPDTEVARTLLGAALPLVVLTVPRPVAWLGSAAAAPSVALIVWAAADGARGRPPALVGAIACLGVLAAEPIARGLGFGDSDRGRAFDPPAWLAPTAAVGVQFAVVAYASRIAGLETRGAIAAAHGAVALLIAGVGATTIIPPPPRYGRPRSEREDGRTRRSSRSSRSSTSSGSSRSSGATRARRDANAARRRDHGSSRGSRRSGGRRRRRGSGRSGD